MALELLTHRLDVVQVLLQTGALRSLHVALLALPIIKRSVRYSAVKIRETRVIRLRVVFLHGGTRVGGWTAKEIHEAVLTIFRLTEKRYRLNQLRYDLRGT
jgi:hypothetical protein